MRTLALCIACLAGPAPAHPSSPSEQVTLFARCEGRFAAIVEYHWLWGDHDRRDAGLRDTFHELSRVATPEGAAIPARAARIRAKAHQARLLRDGMFHPDRRRRDLSRAEARRLARACTAIVLG